MSNSVANFENRYSLSEIIANSLSNIIDKNDAELIPFGSEKIVDNNKALSDFIMSSDSRKNYSAMIVKFAPDFILLKKQTNELFFIEIKVSVTPLCMETNREQMNKIDGRTPDITEIADMDRDAWNAYKNLFPGTIIIDACLYSPKLLSCQFIENIDCLRCFQEHRIPYDCGKCPVKTRQLFETNRNSLSQGSQTPHMNYSLHNFELFSAFFTKLNIRYNQMKLNELLNTLKQNKINFPSFVFQNKRDEIIKYLISKGCSWLKNR